MSINAVGLKAYSQALNNFNKAQKAVDSNISAKTPAMADNKFGETLANSLGEVNKLQTDRSAMISSFASGESQNVHELMIAMQKASLAMNMTAAVRNKVIEAYKELSRIQM